VKIFYVMKGEQTAGPYSIEELRVMLAYGELQRQALCATDGAPAWKPVGDVVDEMALQVLPSDDPGYLPWWALCFGVGFIAVLILAAQADRLTASDDAAGIIFLTIIGIPLYLIPTWAARGCHHKNVTAICALNVLLGWTFVGWVVALVWALKKD
jgi:hypothetical protein